MNLHRNERVLNRHEGFIVMNDIESYDARHKLSLNCVVTRGGY